MRPVVWMALAVVACSGDGDGKTDGEPVITTPEPTTMVTTGPEPVAVPATHFKVKAEGVYDPNVGSWHGWSHVVDGAYDPYISVELLDDSSGTMTTVCTVTMSSSEALPAAEWADTELGAWAAFDMPDDATVTSDCSDDVAAQVARIGWGVSVGLLEGTTAQGLSKSLPAADWSTLSVFLNGSGVRSPALVHESDRPTGYISTGTSIGYELTRHSELWIHETGSYEPIDKNDVLRPGGIRGGFYRMESQILGPAQRLER